jgi:hypothetical protein
MDDNFLKQYRKQPDQAFAEAVYRKISVEERRVSTMNKLVFASIFILAVLGFTLGVSPRARGAALELIREVGGLRFMETSDYPGISENEEILGSTNVPLEEARRIFTGTISLPTFIPAGYNLDPEVELIDFQDGDLPMGIVNWKTNQDGKRRSLWLQIIYQTENVQNLAEVVGEGAMEEITINGKPATLLRGGWNYDTRSYDQDIPSLRIRWMYDERTIYDLNGSQAMGPEVLIRIAESIK